MGTPSKSPSAASVVIPVLQLASGLLMFDRRIMAWLALSVAESSWPGDARTGLLLLAHGTGRSVGLPSSSQPRPWCRKLCASVASPPLSQRTAHRNTVFVEPFAT